MSDLFSRQDLTPMLIGAEGEAFDSPDYSFELKLDGVRCLAYLGEQTDLRNKRNLKVSPIYPELQNIFRQVKGPCILDGELVVISGGRPYFSAIQRRALMSNPTKIRLASSQLPVSFTAFDILYQGGEDLTKLPLEVRKERLLDTVSESEQLAVSRVIEMHGSALYDLTEQQNLEGIVAKRKGSLYFPGKRTKDWIKCKHLKDDDFAICGYIRKSQGVTSLVLGQKTDGQLQYQGHVTLGVSPTDVAHLAALPVLPAPPFPVPPGNEKAVWIAPSLVCSVRYMERTASGSMRQPVFKGIRDDKTV